MSANSSFAAKEKCCLNSEGFLDVLQMLTSFVILISGSSLAAIGHSFYLGLIGPAVLMFAGGYVSASSRGHRNDWYSGSRCCLQAAICPSATGCGVVAVAGIYDNLDRSYSSLNVVVLMASVVAFICGVGQLMRLRRKVDCSSCDGCDVSDDDETVAGSSDSGATLESAFLATLVDVVPDEFWQEQLIESKGERTKKPAVVVVDKSLSAASGSTRGCMEPRPGRERSSSSRLGRISRLTIDADDIRYLD